MPLTKKTTMPAHGDALPGRATPLPLSGKHFVNGSLIKQPAIGGLQEAVFGLGCFWGAERLFWQIPGVVTTSVGTGHAEVVRIVYDPNKVSYEQLLKVFWEAHDPTQGMRQGNDVGTQYRSAIYVTSDAQKKTAEASKRAYQASLSAAHRGAITTEITDLTDYFYAEEYHQQYLAKNPNGYCGLAGCGIKYTPAIAAQA
jgi:peptide-methionine (S)-S-oxide reductase